MSVSDELRQKVNRAPESAGVYLWKDNQGGILYVGKAKSLKNRIRQYLHSKDVKTNFLMNKVEDVDWIATSNEPEALLLENNLIKKNHPPYNIRLKDDKKYPYICVSTGEKFPRVFLTRKKRNPKHTYFGPYVDVRAARNILNAIWKIYPVRKRNLKLPLKTPSRPCINYHIGRCWAPCTGKVSQNDYEKIINNILQFMEGKSTTLEEDLLKEMNLYSDKMEYEKAARIRNLINDIKSLHTKQDMEDSFGEDDYDIIGIYAGNREILQKEFKLESYYVDHLDERYTFSEVALLRIRGGKLIHKATFAMTEQSYAKNGEESSKAFYNEIFDAFIRDFYLNNAEIPVEILAAFSLNHEYEWDHLIFNERRKKINLLSIEDAPRESSRYRLGILANKNAALSLKERMLSEKIRNQRMGLIQIQKMLGLKNAPEVIECYDISNFQGKEAVASGVMLKDGIPFKSGYRKYRIKTKTEPDDPAMIYETLFRRFRRLKTEKKNLPDLIVIDGGITQLRAAIRAKEENHSSVPVISLAKKEEEVYTQDGEIINPDSNSPGMLVLRLARDEAHRFAVAYHRNIRMKRNLKSAFDDIAGVGEKRRSEIHLWLRKKDVETLNAPQERALIEEELPWIKSLKPEIRNLIKERIKDLIQNAT